MDQLADLERIQTQILQKIWELECLILPDQPTGGKAINGDTSTEGLLSAILLANGVNDFIFKRVPSDYYDWPLEARRDILGAASVDHLCKSIVLVNTQAPVNVTDCSDWNYSKYYVVVVQYSSRFNAEAVKNFLYGLNNGKISKKKINSIFFAFLHIGLYEGNIHNLVFWGICEVGQLTPAGCVAEVMESRWMKVGSISLVSCANETDGEPPFKLVSESIWLGQVSRLLLRSILFLFFLVIKSM